MKTVKAICTATILALALSVSAFAGDIASPGITATGEILTPGATTSGNIGSPGATAPGEISSPGFADILMTLLSVLP
jgi:hypothetical protein